MLNKSDVSNQITGLRPKVKQAIVHLAHHLTREIKKCEKRKGVKAEKFLKKAETFRKEVLLLKSIRPDSVSRYALLMDFDDREKLLNDINLSLETKVIVKLATHKSVKSHIEDFRKAHPEYPSKVPHLLETLGIRAKFKKKVQKEQEKQKRKLARRQEKTILESGSNINKNSTNDGDSPASSSDDESDNESGGNENHFEESDNEEIQNDGKISVDEDEDEDESEDEDEDEDSDLDKNAPSREMNKSSAGKKTSIQASTKSLINGSESESSISEEPEEDSESETVASSIRREKHAANLQSSSKSLLAEVRPFSDFQEEKNSGKQRKKTAASSSFMKYELHENNTQGDVESIEEDTFFMTEENSFLKTVAVKRENGEGLQLSKNVGNSDDEEQANQWATDGKKLKGNRAQRRAKFLGRDMNKKKSTFIDQPKMRQIRSSKESNGPSGLGHKFGNGHDMSNNRKTFSQHKVPNRENVKELSKVNGRFSKNKISSSQNPHAPNLQSSSGETLHPSWEAKKRQKVSLNQFEGKKIKFDD